MKNLISIAWVALFVGVAVLRSASSAEPPTQVDPPPIPYLTLDDALSALHAKSGVTFSNEGGWIVAKDLASSTGWLLTPPGHPAYPSIIRRMIVNGPDGAYMVTTVRCLASQEVCDKYFASK
jgi:hypothetical protein